MSPITATAMPEGRASGTGLSATMASTITAWNTEPTLDATNKTLLLRFLPAHHELVTPPHAAGQLEPAESCGRLVALECALYGRLLRGSPDGEPPSSSQRA